MEVFKDFLTLALQLTAIGILFATWWPSRQAKVQLATPIIATNLGQALREKFYGKSDALESIVEDFLDNPSDKNGDKVLLGYRSPFREKSVLEELANSNSTTGPVIVRNLPKSGGKSDKHWAEELIVLKVRYGFEKIETAAVAGLKVMEFERGLLDRLHWSLLERFDYNLYSLPSGEVPPSISRYEDGIDLFGSLLGHVERNCSDNEQLVRAFYNIEKASKVVNIIQLKNNFHESSHNIHLRVSYSFRGTMKLITEVSEAEGFTIKSNTPQYADLVLNELPPNSTRYCLIETGVDPLTEKDIEVQSDLLYRLSPKSMKKIVLLSILGSAIIIGLHRFASELTVL